MNILNNLKTTTAVAALLLAATSAVKAMDVEGINWDAAKSMTAALPHTVKVIKDVDTDTELVGKDGVSPSNQALVIVLQQDGPHVLLGTDYDLRAKDWKKPAGLTNRRTTYRTQKSAHGYGYSAIKDEQGNVKYYTFKDAQGNFVKDENGNPKTLANSREALLKGPANYALYGLFDTIPEENIKIGHDVYSEGGKEWGPAVTIPVFVNYQINLDELNLKGQTAYEEALRKDAQAVLDAKDLSGRIRDFSLVPLSSLLGTGSNDPAVLDSDKLFSFKMDTKLWDECQMRLNILDHVDVVAKQFYGK